MMRLNLLLLILVMGSALYLVRVQYESRRLVTELDRARMDAHRLEAERAQLLAQHRALATSQRVEKLARERLKMQGATPAITLYVDDGRPATGRAL